ncbi:NUDIX hydrolase [Cryptosporangium arvum]|jgi:8-oxo-dGTP pyrophosphatase MutT (NUDIX family)|uniref:NUDIX-domain protein n=1 Tax=Cryptosporangium arvum DSM 44712 TaxID=927661 RepID=A0A010YGA4_9ACTN|nr:NUDIX hydrolase [Cryptosporangium arvum]EXG79245.1 NUDIX-domain protein [Cryptosporangium arvum DSM 44712]
MVSGVRDAATTVLLRDAPGGLEAYLMVRSTRLSAFAGLTVFPGGSVDPGDHVADELWRGPDPARWPLSADPGLSRALVTAAVRETFEEIGVLLAEGASFPSADELQRDRAALEDHRVTLPELLTARGLVIRTDLIRPWTHWITPEAEKRRFDTRFFVAGLPAGQDAQQPSGEATRGFWQSPAGALAAVERGEFGMLPPTASTLLGLVEFGTLADVFAAAENRTIRPIRPVYRGDAEGPRLTLPPESLELLPPGVTPEFIAGLMSGIARHGRPPATEKGSA